MDWRSKLLLFVAITLTLIAIGLTYQRAIIASDFSIITVTSCDHEAKTCFEYLPECENEEACEPEYYTVVSGKAADLALACDGSLAECDPIPCEDGTCVELACDSLEGQAYAELLGECALPGLSEQEGVTEEEEMPIQEDY